MNWLTMERDYIYIITYCRPKTPILFENVWLRDSMIEILTGTLKE